MAGAGSLQGCWVFLSASDLLLVSLLQGPLEFCWTHWGNSGPSRLEVPTFVTSSEALCCAMSRAHMFQGRATLPNRVFGGQFCYSADHRVTALTFNPILFEIATKPRSVFRALAMLSSLTEPVFLAYKVGIM